LTYSNVGVGFFTLPLSLIRSNSGARNIGFVRPLIVFNQLRRRYIA